MTRLDLPDGQFIDVKDKLQVRDKRDVHTYSVDGVSSDGKTYRFNVVKHQIATAAVRITGWSLPDAYPNGKRSTTADKIAVIEGLDEDIFEAITTVLDAHDKAATAEAEAEKNETPGWRDRLRTDYAICRALNGWTLETVRALTVEDYDEILGWLHDEADRVRGGEGSVDMDALIADRHKARGEDD